MSKSCDNRVVDYRIMKNNLLFCVSMRGNIVE